MSFGFEKKKLAQIQSGGGWGGGGGQTSKNFLFLLEWTIIMYIWSFRPIPPLALLRLFFPVPSHHDKIKPPHTPVSCGKIYKLLLKVTWSYLARARTAGGTGRPLLPWCRWKDIQLDTIHFFDFCDIFKFLSFKTLLFIFQRHFSPLFSSNRRFPSAFIKSPKLMDSAAFCPPAWLWSTPDICQFRYTTALCRLGL